jgi:hypothetical protein
MDELIHNMEMTEIVDPCPVCANPLGLCVDCKIICENYLSEVDLCIYLLLVIVVANI